jgi:hypothetical protein
VKFAYADPPYYGCAILHYGDHPEAAVYDTIDGHKTLIDRLVAEFPDGWALSLHQKSLRVLLPLCPDDVRIGAWVKPFASFRPNVNPGYCWEPVIFRGGRKRERYDPTVRDFVSAGITLRRGVVGAKPDAFCWWVFDFLGMAPDDEFHDLFPGSGAVTRAWQSWRRAQNGFLFATEAAPEPNPEPMPAPGPADEDRPLFNAAGLR